MFLIFSLKHRLWRVNLAVVLACTHSLCFEQKYEIYRTFSSEICHFHHSDSILHRHAEVIITQTRPCNIQQYFTAVKMVIFR